jgi:predicted phage terminase large subunit-like protein
METLYHLERPITSIYIESAGFQLTYVQAMRRKGLPIRELKADRDKYSRALFASSRFEGEGIFLPVRAPWKQALEDELLSFPFSGHDDQVDVISYGCMVTGARAPLSIRLVT